MNKKVLSFGVVLVALVGSLLAAFIPAASASKVGHAKAPRGITCTYSEYSECGYATFTAGPGIKVGTVLARGVVVTDNNFGDLVISDNGKTIQAPDGATVTVSSNGTILVNTINGKYGKGDITVIGGKVSTIYLQTANGITFGGNHSKATILKYVKFYNGASKESVSAVLVSKPHGKLLVGLKTATANPIIYINGGIFQYTKEEANFIKSHHAKKAAVTVKLGTTTGSIYTFKMYVPIGKLWPQK